MPTIPLTIDHRYVPVVKAGPRERHPWPCEMPSAACHLSAFRLCWVLGCTAGWRVGRRGGCHGAAGCSVGRSRARPQSTLPPSKAQSDFNITNRHYTRKPVEFGGMPRIKARASERLTASVFNRLACQCC